MQTLTIHANTEEMLLTWSVEGKTDPNYLCDNLFENIVAMNSLAIPVSAGHSPERI